MDALLVRSILLFLICGLPLQAQRRSPPLSYLHRVLLDRAPVIVKARFAGGRDLPRDAVVVTRFEVVKHLRGKTPGHVLVAGMGDRARAWRDLEKLLFLAPMSSGRLFKLVDLIDLVPEEAAAREDAVRFRLGLGERENPLAAARLLKRRVLRDLRSESGFARRLAVRDLTFLVRGRPELFTAADLARVQEMPKGLAAGDQRVFARTLDRLRDLLALPFPGYQEVFRDARERGEFLEASALLKRTRDPQERARALDGMVTRWGSKLRRFCERLVFDSAPPCAQGAIRYLGEFGAPASVPVLARALDGADLSRSAALIDALGMIGSDRAMPLLRARLESRELLDSVILALGRIGGPEADTILARLERVLSELPAEAPRLRRLREVRSEAFRKDEVARRLALRRKHQK